MKDIYKTIIIGSGPAGLTAGIYSARAHMEPLIIEGKNPGGQLMNTTFVENWPGEKKILGPQLMLNMRDHAKQVGCTFLSQEIVKVDFTQQPFTLWTSANKKLQANSIIIATGAAPRRLNVPGEAAYWGKGVTSCAVCDGALYKDQPVVIVGGGDTAMEDASFMTNFTDKITVIHILDKFTASQAMQQRVINNPKIKILYSSTVTEIQGENDRITQVLATDKITGKQTIVPAAGVFIAIGMTPNTIPFKDQLPLSAYGYIETLQGTTKTSIPGIFAAGDVADPSYKQAITSAAAGCKAALDAQRYLETIVEPE